LSNLETNQRFCFGRDVNLFHNNKNKEFNMKPEVKAFFDDPTSTMTYIVYDSSSKDAILIDPVLNYDPNSGKISFESLNEVEEFVKKQDLKLRCSLETHAHADHLSGAYYLKKRFPETKVGIGENIVKVQKLFSEVFNMKDLKTDGSQFDFLLSDGEELKAGTLTLKTIHTPGHTPACSSYLVGDALFAGDTLFMPDFGTARVDFPAGSAHDLYDSIHNKLYALPDDTRVFVGHDYQPGGRKLEFETTIKEEKEKNIQIPAGTSEEKYTKFRSERDAKLDAPRLLLPSIQVNIAGGELPAPEDNEVRYIKTPLKIQE